jgi:hypothetical protein
VAFVGGALSGIGMGMVFAPAINAGTFGVAPQDSGVASATLTVGQMLGGSIGTALLNSIFAASPGRRFQQRIDMGEPAWGAAGRIPAEGRCRDHAKGSQVRRVRRDRRVAGRGGGTPGARGRAGPGAGEGGRHQHLDVPIANVYPLAQVRQAYTELERRHTHGKIVLRL